MRIRHPELAPFGTSSATSLTQSSEAVCPAVPHIKVQTANVVYNIIVPGGEVDKVPGLLEIEKQSDCGQIDRRRPMSLRKVFLLVLFFLALLSIVLVFLDVTSLRTYGRSSGVLESWNKRDRVCAAAVVPGPSEHRLGILGRDIWQEAWRNGFSSRTLERALMDALVVCGAMFVASGHKGCRS